MTKTDKLCNRCQDAMLNIKSTEDGDVIECPSCDYKRKLE